MYDRHRRWIPAAAFVCGFLIDIARLGRIDSWFSIAQQGFFLVLAAFILGCDIARNESDLPPLIDSDYGLIGLFWRYREALLHLMLGKLLSVYTLFYFKSASLFASILFMILLATILVMNEFRRFGPYTTSVRVTLYSLCLLSYFIYLVPIFLGRIGEVPFFISLICATVCFVLFYLILSRVLRSKPLIRRNRLRIPFLSVLVGLTFLYLVRAIPPVPLSVQYMGIFHHVEKKNGHYELSYTRSKWKAWQRGDQSFLARPGDKIYCFVRVFSPGQFKDRLQVRWFYKDSQKGSWERYDAIPMEIVGGRKEGYRGYTVKANYQVGKWRVQIETSDERELARIYFEVRRDSGTAERKFNIKRI